MQFRESDYQGFQCKDFASQGGEVNVFKYIILCNVRITNQKYCKAIEYS